jgi:hypothetical protein
MTSRRIELCILLAGCASTPRAELPSAQQCGQQSWLERPPAMTAARVFGVGSGRTRSDALDVARAEAAKTIGVQVQEDATDTQMLWLADDHGRQQESSRTTLKRATRSLVDRRLESCQQADLCRAADGQTQVLVSCERVSGLERALVETARQWSNVAGPMRVLAVPGTDADGFITQLGLYMVNVLRDQLGEHNHALAIVDSGPWQPAELHEAARQAGATHLLRVEYLSPTSTSIRATAYFQDATTDQRVPATTSTFEVELDDGQTSMLAVRGSLLPQRDAQNLIGLSGGYHVPLDMPSTELREGDAIGFSFKLPRAGFVYLFDLYEDGSAALFVPSPLLSDNHFAAGAEVRVPLANERGKLLACALPGQAVTREYLKLLIVPTPLTSLQPSAGALQVLHGGPNGELDRLVAELNAAPDEERGTGELAYNIQRASETPRGCKTQR